MINLKIIIKYFWIYIAKRRNNNHRKNYNKIQGIRAIILGKTSMRNQDWKKK